MNKTTWLADAFDWAGEVFERFNPAAFRFLAAILPYMTPFPVAWLTMRSAETFLDFTPGVAFAFVFGLEGMGLWFTSLFVDAVIDWIRSRNAKTSALVVLFGLVVTAYVFLLVNLNVTLKTSTGNSDPALERVITLLCFLPLLTGVGNGYYKWKLETKGAEQKVQTDAKALEEKRHQEQVEIEERDKERARQDKLQRRMIKAGMNPLTVQMQSVVETPAPAVQAPKKSDWRVLSQKEKFEVKHSLTIQQIVDAYGVSRVTAYNWKAMDV